MSLQLVANHLAQKGRGPDSTLVHMSNREVAGLNALAKKHGGQLSVNPDTGLPEAGFLDNLLPMVAGAGLTYFSGGAINPLMAGGIIGGITALDSKDLSKGLVAGLGTYGGAGMVGGLAGLGATSTGANEVAREAAVNSAIQNGTYQSSVGSGLSEFAAQPMASLSTLGGGSALKGSLPILAGLAPAAAEAFDEEDEGDGAPEQKKGYIRKYALDPVTGQYKQVGVYEAGGDPNVDVTAKAGTAGSYGGVGQSEYEAAQGMAEGGTTDSSRIYDYLMGRGPNPMQFTRVSRPQVDYNLPKTDAPITPTTPILEDVYDPYGNIQRGGGNYSLEKREENLAAVNDYLNVGNDGMSLNKFFDLRDRDPVAAKALEDKAAEASPFRAGVLKAAKVFAPNSFLFQGLDAAGNVIKNMFKPNVDMSGDPYTYYKGAEFGSAPYLKNPYGSENFPAAKILPGRQREGPVSPTPQGDPRQQQEARTREGAEAMSRSTDNTGGQGAHPNASIGGWGMGEGRASGGAIHPYAHGGIANLHQYNLGSYSDGGRLLKGPGDGISDDIPAIIGHNQPARLADNEFVIPARIVSEIGNGSTDAGARKLYAMMDRIQKRRAKTVGKDKIAVNSGAYKEVDRL